MVNPEAKLYLPRDLDTGRLRYASSELLKRNLDVVDFYMYMVSRITAIVGSRPAEKAIAVALNPNNLKEKPKNKWLETESKVAALLIHIGAMRNPGLTDTKIAESSRPIPSFDTAQDALQFLKLAFSRLSSLLSPEEVQRLDSLRQMGTAYAESRILNRAIFDGVYLVPPHFI